jgi:hypothetical protein
MMTNTEVLSRFEEGKPADPTKDMSPEDAEKWREEHEKNKDRFKTSAERVVGRYHQAGYGYGVSRMSVVFVPKSKSKPFNRDTIQDINNTTIKVVADDGGTYEAPLRVIGHQTSGPLAFHQESAGERQESRVDLEHPVDEGGNPRTSARAALAALAALGKKLGFRVEPSRAGYRPVTRKT